jgi:hypothetical protein
MKLSTSSWGNEYNEREIGEECHNYQVQIHYDHLLNYKLISQTFNPLLFSIANPFF